jgi:hypothetical protein
MHTYIYIIRGALAAASMVASMHMIHDFTGFKPFKESGFLAGYILGMIYMYIYVCLCICAYVYICIYICIHFSIHCYYHDLRTINFIIIYYDKLFIFLASLGRGLLHGDLQTTGDKHLTIWKIKNIDFIALQGA